METLTHSFTSIFSSHRTAALGLASLLWLVVTPAAQAFLLVSPDEFARSEAAPHIETKAVLVSEPGAPEIVVISPQAKGRIQTPMDIRLAFVPAEGSQIDRESIRILYGWLKLDITDRVLKHASFSTTELSASGADIPAGNHKILIRVSDNRGRTGERVVRFTAVEDVASAGTAGFERP